MEARKFESGYSELTELASKIRHEAVLLGFRPFTLDPNVTETLISNGDLRIGGG